MTRLAFVLGTLLVLVGCESAGGGSTVDLIAPEDATPDTVELAARFGAPELNPTGNTPLAAEVSFAPPAEVMVEIAVAGLGAGEAPFAARLHVAGQGGVVRLPVLGLFPDHENRVSFRVTSPAGDELGTHEVTIATAPLPEDFPRIVSEGTHDPEWFTYLEWLRTPTARAEVVGLMVDVQGRIRWYSAFPEVRLHPMKIFRGTLYAGDGGDLLLRYDFLGHELARIDLAQHAFTRIHHDMFRKADGSLLLTVDRMGSAYIEDRVIELDPERNTLRGRWNLADVLPDVADLFYDLPLTSADLPGITNDPVHINSVAHDDRDDSLLVCSQRTGVAKVYRSGQLKWLLAPHLLRHIDDADGDGVSDSLADGYDVEVPTSRVGDYRGDTYADLRYPVNGEPVQDYSGFVFDYGAFLLTPIDSDGSPIDDSTVRAGFTDHEDFAWPFRPHAPTLLANGNLLLFDNGLGRHFALPFSPEAYSRAVEYAIEEDASDGFGGTVRQVWDYRLPADPPWYAMSVLVGDVDELPNGNRLITSGAVGSSFLLDTGLGDYGGGPHGAIVVEVDPATNTEVHTLRVYRTITADFPVTEFTVYRAERVDPYAAWKTASLGGE